MILVLNGYPGTGKLTIGQALAPMMGAKLVDIHTIYNLAFALTEFRTQAFFDATDRVEAIAHDLIHDLPLEVPVLWTTVLAGDSDRAIAAWNRLIDLGRARPPLLMVHIHCDLEENIRRIQGESRIGARKPLDPEYGHRNHGQAKPLMHKGADLLLELDTTRLSQESSARAIETWASGLG
jgi:chloramphenicol 3-O-phosphotransferase